MYLYINHAIYVYVYIYIYIYVCVCVCVCVYPHTHVESKDTTCSEIKNDLFFQDFIFITIIKNQE